MDLERRSLEANLDSSSRDNQGQPRATEMWLQESASVKMLDCPVQPYATVVGHVAPKSPITIFSPIFLIVLINYCVNYSQNGARMWHPF